MKNMLIIVLVVMFGSVNAQETNARLKKNRASSISSNHVLNKDFQKSINVTFELDSVIFDDLNYENIWYDFNFINGLQTESVSNNPEQSSIIGIQKDLFQYNENNQLIFKTTLIKDTTIVNSSWDFYRKVDFVYDGMLKYEITSKFDTLSDQWKESYRFICYYDADGNDTLISHEAVNGSSHKYRRTFENNQLVKQQFVYYTPDFTWDNIWFTIYNYDSILNVVEEMSYDSDSTPTSKTLRYYDEFYNPQLFTYYDWNIDSNRYDLESKLEYFSTELGTEESINLGLINYIYDGILLTNQVKTTDLIFHSKDSTSSWINDLSVRLVYKKVNTSILEHQITNFTIAPNPASDNIQLKWDGSKYATLVIYNSFGKQVKSVSIRNGKPVLVNDLSNGLYYVHITDEFELNTIKSIIIAK
jgi:hypothetical protein